MWISLTLALLTATPSVKQALDRYDRGDYRGAQGILSQALAMDTLSPPERATARLYLAACLDLLGEESSAKRVLTLLMRENPDVRVDALLFPRRFVLLTEQVREAVDRERVAQATPPVLKPAPPNPAPHATPKPSDLPWVTQEPLVQAKRSAQTEAQRSFWVWVPGLAGAALLGVATVFMFEAQQEANLLSERTGPLTLSQAQAHRNEGLLDEGLAYAFAAGGVVGVGVTGGLLLFSPTPGTKPVVGIGLSGTLP